MYQFVFLDLYGTLLDISTDESSPKPWQALFDYLTTLQAESGAAAAARAIPDDSPVPAVPAAKSITSPDQLQTVFRQLEEEEMCRRVKIEKAEGRLETDRSQIEIDIARVYQKIFSLMGIGREGLMKKTGKDPIDEAAELFRSASRLWVRSYTGVQDFLDNLKGRGIITVLASNAQELYTRSELNPLRSHLDRVFISSAIGYKKPSARFFSYIVKTVGARPDKTLMIGNEEKTDMAGSHALGMDGILLNTGIDSHSATARLVVDGPDYGAVYDFIVNS